MSVSRQRLEQIRNRDRGMCIYHKDSPKYKSGYCLECYHKFAARKGVKKPHPLKEQWSKMDWSKPDWEIMRDLNVTQSAVKVQRAKTEGRAE